MDTASESIAAFLEALQDRMRDLRSLCDLYRDAGATPSRPHLSLSGRPFTVREEQVTEYTGSLVLGLLVRGQDGREYDLGVDLLWCNTHWVIETQIWVANDNGGSDLLRELPKRSTVDFKTCMRALAEAVGDLATFRNIMCP